MLTLPLALLLAIAPPPESATATPTDEVDLSEAARLFDEGLTRYEAADYESAIEIFTQALSELRDQGVEDFRIRGLLLFNIGRAHMRAHEIDRDIEHVRQAKAIFTRFVEQAAEVEHGAVAPEDVTEAEQQLRLIAELLAAAEADESDAPAPVEGPSEPLDEEPERAPSNDEAAARARKLGVGLTVGGVVVLGGGVGLAVWGSGFAARAEDQVAELDDLGLPEDHPAFAAGDQFVRDERRKGTAWMAGGGVAAGVGVALLAAGVQQLVTAKQLRRAELTAVGRFGNDGLFLGVAGRF